MTNISKKNIPSFFVVGAQKAGTTTLFEILKQHPEIYLPEQKELRFFSWNYEKGFDWYCKEYFSSVRNSQIAGEVSPDYLIHKDVPKRIFKNCGKNVKIIILMRQPARRAYSEYIMNSKSKHKEWTKFSFPKQLEEENIGNIESDYITQGLYFQHYQRFREFFKEENILPIVFEEMVGSEKICTIKKITTFLGISSNSEVYIEKHSNQASLPRYRGLNFIYGQNIILNHSRKMVSKLPLFQKLLKKFLTVKPEIISESVLEKITCKYFNQDIKKLENNLNINLSRWKFR